MIGQDPLILRAGQYPAVRDGSRSIKMNQDQSRMFKIQQEWIAYPFKYSLDRNPAVKTFTLKQTIIFGVDAGVIRNYFLFLRINILKMLI